MAVALNHTIVPSDDAERGAAFLSEVLGLGAPTWFAPFWVVDVANGVGLDYMDTDEPVHGIHYAFLVSEDEFDAIFGRIQSMGLEYFADPHRQQPGEINHHDGGRGVYFASPEGHWLEAITRPYGSGG